MKKFKIILFSIFVAMYALGICIGSMRQVVTENQNDMFRYLETAMSGYDLSFKDSFKSILTDNLKLLFCLFIGGLFLPTTIILPVVIIFKGYSAGFAITAVLRFFGLRGLLFCIANFVSAAMIIPAICWYSCVSVANVLNKKYEKEAFFKGFFLLLVIMLILLVADSAIRGAGSAWIMKLVNI